VYEEFPEQAELVPGPEDGQEARRALTHTLDDITQDVGGKRAGCPSDPAVRGAAYFFPESFPDDFAPGAGPGGGGFNSVMSLSPDGYPPRSSTGFAATLLSLLTSHSSMKSR